ncbi:DUF2752 domain-containing protein [Streptomyces sp. SDr-06]|uniref:DUF2752 domain-containing protein n=1 Tax=Streptomyces sp. SDr-06 TaxID=2267702 RepID=UPI001CB90655|nr:DUF2752 domain-containing protein [Streptomyces sp. SDr-06]
MAEPAMRQVAPSGTRPGRNLRLPLAVQPVAVAVAALAGLLYLYGHSPYEPAQLLPRCPFHWLTGLNCPACGGTRMAYAFVHGDMAAAFRANPALCAALPLAAYAYTRWSAACLRGQRYRLPLGRRGSALILGAALAWTVLRNILGR